MRTSVLLAAAVLSAAALRAQTVSTFESLPLSTADTYYVNNSSPGQDVGFQSGGAYFPRVNQEYMGTPYWGSGFGYSNGTDTVDASYDNEHSARPGSGHSGSEKYGYAYGQENYILNLDSTQRLSGVWLTNTTLAYRSLLNGDFYAKKFGGATGNDPDYYRAIFKAYNNGVQSGTPMSFYFADFRDANNANDYIVKDWTWMQFPDLAWDSLVVTLESSDTGTFGINTPLYWALDDLILTPAMGVRNSSLAQSALQVSPVPARGVAHFSAGSAIGGLTILDACGTVVHREAAVGNQATVNVADWSKGVYLVRCLVDGTPVSQKLIVE